MSIRWRRAGVRSAIPLILALSFGVAGACTPAPSPELTAPGVTDTPTAVTTTSAPSLDARPLDPAAATDLVRRYENALVMGNWQAAWADLAPGGQRWKSFAAFVAERQGFLSLARDRFALRPPITDPAEIQLWVANVAPPGTPDTGVLVEVDYPALTDNSGWEMLLVARDSSGVTRIWVLR